MIRFIFSDVDGTLFGDDQIIPEKNIEMIKRAREKGARFVVLTGRVPCIIGSILDDLEIPESKEEFYIGANGGLIMNTKGDILYRNPIKKENVLKLIDLLQGEDIDAFACVETKAYHFLKDRHQNSNWDDSSVFEDSLDDFKKKLEELDIFKLYVLNQDGSIFPQLAKKISEVTNGEVRGVQSRSIAMEVFNTSTSKGKALKEFCKINGCDIKDTIGIGDSYNDVEMLEECGIPTCPDNAVQDIKNMCRYVSPLTCEEGAVGEIIERYVLNGEEDEH